MSEVKSYDLAPQDSNQADIYDKYMDGPYDSHRGLLEPFWQMHYQEIKEIIIEKIKKVIPRIQYTGIQFIGITGDDFKNGGVPLKEEIEKGMSLANALNKSPELVFSNISSVALNEVSRVFLEEVGENRNSNIHLATESISKGSPVYTIFTDSLKHNAEYVSEVYGVDRLIEQLQFSINTQLPFLLRSAGKNVDKPYPEVVLGFSLMTHTSTLVPIKELLMDVLSIETTKNNYSTEVVLKKEKDIFNIMEQYNDWLMEFSLANWFAQNPKGELYIFTDTGIQFYKKNTKGEYQNTNIDKTRCYNVINPKYKSMIESWGYNVDIESQWIWKDEPDHQHPVVAIKITKN